MTIKKFANSAATATNGQVLTVDHTQPGDVKWAASQQAFPVVSATQTFTNATSVSLSNIFSSTYDNYRVLVQITGNNSSTNILRLRFRTSAGDDSAAQYYYQVGNFYNGTTSPTTIMYGQAFAYADITYGYGTATAFSLDIHGPNLARKTNWVGISNAYTANATASYRTLIPSGMMYTDTQYTGLTFYTSDSTAISGSITVYGYNKS